jgi:PAS domain S-box-containing protein
MAVFLGWSLSAVVGEAQEVPSPEAPWRLADFTADAGIQRRQVFDVAFETNKVAWFAVSDGLYRYDGYRWTRYTTEDGLPSGFVRTVSVTRDGSVWIGTDNGAGVFNGKGFDRRGTEGRLSGPNVRRIVEGPDGALWFCCDRWPNPGDPGGLTRMKDGVFRSFGKEDGLPSDNLVNLFVRRDGTPLAMTAKGIAAGSGERWKPVDWTGFPNAGTPWDLVETEDGTLLVSTGGLLMRLEKGTWVPLTEVPSGGRIQTGIDGNPVCVQASNDGTARFFRWRDGRFEPGSSIFTGEGIGFEAVRQAPDGSVWGVGRGVIRRWENLPGQWIWRPDLPPPVGEDSKGGLWFSNSRRAVRMKDGVSSEIPGLSGQLGFDSDGNVWGAGGVGLARWQDGVLESVPESVSGIAKLDRLQVDGAGSVWFLGKSTDGSLRLSGFVDSKWIHVDTRVFKGRGIRTFEADPIGGLWVVSTEVDRTGYSVHFIRGAVPETQVIAEGGDGISWPRLRASKDRVFLFGYRGLLETLKPNPWRLRPSAVGDHVFTETASLSDVSVFLSQEGPDGQARIHVNRDGDWMSHPIRFGQSLWLGGDGTLLVGDGSEIVLWETRKWSSPTYVALPDDATIRSMLRTRDGSIWVETRNGVIGPGTVPTNPPETLLDGPQRFTVGSDARLLARGAEAFAPQSRHRRYSFNRRVDGGPWSGYLDWPEKGLPLDGLAIGPHAFEVRARDGLGNEDPTPARFDCVVRPLPIEDQRWFRPALAIAGMSFAVLSVALFGVGRRLRRQTAGLEAEVRDRTAELRADIERRQQAEASALRLNERLSLALKAGRFGVWDWDAIRDHTAWDDRMYEIFGIEPSRFDGSHDSWMELILPEDRPSVLADMQRAFDGRKDYVTRYRIRLPDGSIRHIAAEGYLHRDANGRIVRAIGLNMDVTDQETTRAELEGREDRVRRLNECIAKLVLEDTGEATDLEALFQRLTEQVADAVQVARVGIWLLDAEDTLLRCETLFEADGRRHSPGARLEVSEYPAYFSAVRSESRLVADDVLSDPRTAEMVEGYFKPLGISSMLDVAIQSAGTLRGVLCMEHIGPRRRWHPDEIGFVSAVGALVGQALESMERRRAEAELVKNQLLLGTTGQLARVGGWEMEVVDSSPGTLIWSDQVRRIHQVPDGFVPELGRAIAFYSPESRPRIEAALREAIDHARPYDLELVLTTALGRQVPVRAIGTPEVVDGRVVRLVGALQDISDIRAAEAALREERVRLASIIEAARVGTWEWNVQTGETVFNARWAEIVGYSLSELQPTSIETWIRLTHPDDLSRSETLLKDHFEGRLEYYECECRMLHKAGHWVWIQDRGRVITRDGTGRPVMMFGTHTDISERRRSEEKERGLRELLARAERMESVGRLAGGVAHDFNNMLQAILGYTTLALLDTPEDSAVRENLEEIRRSAERSADLTRQLLAFARKQTAAPKVVDLNQTIGGMLKMLRRLIGEDIILSWEPGADVWPITIDPGQMDQVLANLCVNARDALDGGGRITIATSNADLDELALSAHPEVEPGRFVRLLVEDNGHGMSPETLASIFEPFFTTKEVGKGTGLGLATVFGIVTQNRGFIDVSSTVGLGTRFMIHFPRSKSEAAAPETPAVAPRLESAQGTLLLVEDEEQVLRFARQVLQRQGYTVLDASNPMTALDVVARFPGRIDLLVTDVVMPGMNGRQLHERLLATNPGLRCLYMSGYTADVIATHGVLQEGVAFLQKPFGIEPLVAKVKEVLQRKWA